VAEYQDKITEPKVLTRMTSHRDWFMKEAIQFQLHPDTSIRSGQQSILELWNNNKNSWHLLSRLSMCLKPTASPTAIQQSTCTPLWVEIQCAAVSIIILTFADGRISEALDINLNFTWLIT
jgi:hypothetical protein